MQDGFTARMKRQLEREFFAIERNPAYTPDQKVDRLIKTTAALCAGIAAQPIPFADMPILTSIQAFMGYKIAQVRGIQLTETGAWEALKYVGGVIGLGFIAQQTALGLYKIGLPGLGGFMTIPLVGGLTVGIGRVLDLYFVYKHQGRLPSNDEIRRAFAAGREEGKAIKPRSLEGGPAGEPESKAP